MRVQLIRRTARIVAYFVVASVLALVLRVDIALSQEERRREQTTKARGGSDIVAQTAAEFAVYTDSDAVTVVSPSVAATIRDPISGWSATGSYLVDVVSAASVDIVATATPRWTEVRHVGAVEGTYKPHDFSASLSGSVSREPDYLSAAVGGSASIDLANKQVTPLLGYALSHDVAGRSDTPFSVYALPLNRHTISAAVTLVLQRSTEIQLVDDVILEDGNQIKPYRYLPVFAPGVADRVPVGASIDTVNRLRLPGRMAEQTPLTRHRFALSGRLAHRGSHTTLILFERVYTDDWGVRASTSSARLVVEPVERLSFWPEARLHVQTGASFWQRAYTAVAGSSGLIVPEYRSGDRELGPLWTPTLGLGARWNIGGALHPRSFSWVAGLEGSRTEYEDAIYVDHRYSFIATLALEASFE